MQSKQRYLNGNYLVESIDRIMDTVENRVDSSNITFFQQGIEISEKLEEDNFISTEFACEIDDWIFLMLCVFSELFDEEFINELTIFCDDEFMDAEEQNATYLMI